jgi:uncharacterized Zn-finger protein
MWSREYTGNTARCHFPEILKTAFCLQSFAIMSLGNQGLGPIGDLLWLEADICGSKTVPLKHFSFLPRFQIAFEKTTGFSNDKSSIQWILAVNTIS